MKTVTMLRVYMFNPHQGHLGGMDMPIQARSRKALDKKAAAFERCGCTVKWDTLTTVQVER